jgi:hypothetical protein
VSRAQTLRSNFDKKTDGVLGRYNINTMVYRPVQVSRNLFSFDVTEKHPIRGFNFTINNFSGMVSEFFGLSPFFSSFF